MSPELQLRARAAPAQPDAVGSGDLRGNRAAGGTAPQPTPPFRRRPLLPLSLPDRLAPQVFFQTLARASVYACSASAAPFQARLCLRMFRPFGILHEPTSAGPRSLSLLGSSCNGP